jgi:hypothetical protein
MALMSAAHFIGSAFIVCANPAFACGFTPGFTLPPSSTA